MRLCENILLKRVHESLFEDGVIDLLVNYCGGIPESSFNCGTTNAFR
ncbi:MAG: hypothetical protein R2865_05900 [Deinococcales bacterium]